MPHFIDQREKNLLSYDYKVLTDDRFTHLTNVDILRLRTSRKCAFADARYLPFERKSHVPLSPPIEKLYLSELKCHETHSSRNCDALRFKNYTLTREISNWSPTKRMQDAGLASLASLTEGRGRL